MLAVFLKEIETDLILLANKPVIEAAGRLANAIKRQDNQDEISEKYDSLLKHMRRDLGHSQSYDELSGLKLNFVRSEKEELREGKSVVIN